MVPSKYEFLIWCNMELSFETFVVMLNIKSNTRRGSCIMRNFITCTLLQV
jgi:hypothetical protein